MEVQLGLNVAGVAALIEDGNLASSKPDKTDGAGVGVESINRCSFRPKIHHQTAIGIVSRLDVQSPCLRLGGHRVGRSLRGRDVDWGRKCCGPGYRERDIGGHPGVSAIDAGVL